MDDGADRPADVARSGLRGATAPPAGAGGSLGVPPEVLEVLATGRTLRGLVVAVEPAALGEWAVRLRFAGDVVQVRSRVSVEVGSVQEFRAPDAARPRLWTVVTRSSNAFAGPAPSRSSPGARLGSALLARGAFGRAAGDVAQAGGHSAGAAHAESVLPPSPRSPVLHVGPGLTRDAVAAAFEVFRDGALLGALLDEVAADGDARPARTAWPANGEAGLERHARPAADALRALGSGVVEFGRAVDRGGGLLPIPVPFEAGRGVEELRCFVSREREPQDRAAHAAAEQSFLVVLLLELSELGALRIDVRTRAGSLSVRFAAETAATRTLLGACVESLRDDLANGLREAGLPGSIELSVAAPAEAGSLLAELLEVARVTRSAEGLDVHV